MANCRWATNGQRNSHLPKNARICDCFRPIRAGCAVSSVVEHYLDTVGVRGSKPLPRTISNYQYLLIMRYLIVILIPVMMIAGDLRAAEPPIIPCPLFHEATNEFQVMKTTLYQHQTRVDRDTGNYRYDCVGFVSYALKQATPQAWASTVKVTGIAKGRIPSPPRYQTFFAGLVQNPQPGWQAVTNVSDLRPGDVVAWEHKSETAVGHAVVIASAPKKGPEGDWIVEVYDSTSSPHSEDSRPNDSRAQTMESTGRHSGLGHGVMGLVADPVTGNLTGYRWSPKAKPVTAPIAAARPTS